MTALVLLAIVAGFLAAFTVTVFYLLALIGQAVYRAA